MEILILIILGITGGVMIATVAASGIYYSYRSKKGKKDKEKTAAAKVTTNTKSRRFAHVDSESFVLIQDESVVDFDSIPVQPETRRPIRYRSRVVWDFCGNVNERMTHTVLKSS